MSELTCLSEKREEKLKEVETIEAEMSEWEAALRGITQPQLFDTIVIRNPIITGKESLRKAVVRVMKTAGRFLHISEIKQLLNSENDFADTETDKISRTLTGLKMGKNPYELTTVRKGLMSNTFWGFINYVEADGEPLPDRMYDTSLIKTERSKKTETTPNEVVQDSQT